MADFSGEYRKPIDQRARMDSINSDPLPNSQENISAKENLTADGGGEISNSEGAKKEHLYLPLTNVTRIMRKVLPAKAKISDDAKHSVKECVAEFMSFITGEAHDRCKQEKRKALTGEDLIWAMNRLGFDDYVEPLQNYLRRYRMHEDTHGGPSFHPEQSQLATHHDAYDQIFPGIPPPGKYPDNCS